MGSPARPQRRHARRSSSQSWARPTPAEPQTPMARRRNLYRPPASVVTRHARVQHWNAELDDLTENLAQIQQRIQQLETLQDPHHVSQDVPRVSAHPTGSRRSSQITSEESITPASRPLRVSRRVSQESVRPLSHSRAPATPFRLPELQLDSTDDSLHLHLGHWLHASPAQAPTSCAVPLSPVKNANEESSPLGPPASAVTRRSARVRRTAHLRDGSTNTIDSFDSYTTDAVHVYEASTAAFVRPSVKFIAPASAAFPSVPNRSAPRLASSSHAPDVNKENQDPAALVPLPLFAGQKSGVPRPDSCALQPRSSSLALPSHVRKESRQSQPSPCPVRDPDWRADIGSRPVSETTVIRLRRLSPPSPTPLRAWDAETSSIAWATESLASDEQPCPTSSAPHTPWPSFSGAGITERAPTPHPFQRRRQHPSSPITEAPCLDSSCTSISDLPTPTSSPPTASARLNLFPRIQQSSYESLGRRYHSAQDKDPFYTVCPDQDGCVRWPSLPNPTSNAEAAETAAIPSTDGPAAEELSRGPSDPAQRKEHRLREILSPGVKRQTRDMGSNHNLVRSPRKKLRTFLRRFTPNMNKSRYSTPAPVRSSMSLDKRFKTPPRLPTRQGSSLPFDEALLGELSRISDRGHTGSSLSPAKRIRNSMHDAAGLTLSKTAATRAHWRAQRSRASMSSSMHLRSRAPTGSTLYSSLSSGPSFHFLPKVDQIPITPVRRGPPPARHRKSRY